MDGMENVRCVPSDWEEEDCSYLLRELERTAFSCVVSAMRAQGIMNNFKEVLLDHLKAALFINDDVYKLEMKRAANDECLSKIASVLNPSYDCFTEWAGLGVDVEDDEFVPQPRIFDEGTTLSTADALLVLASGHNSDIENCDIALAELLRLPRVPYVPERLRHLLRETESLHTDRIFPPEVLMVHSASSEKRERITKTRRRRSTVKLTTEQRNETIAENESVDDNMTNSLVLPQVECEFETKLSSIERSPISTRAPLLTPCKSESGNAGTGSIALSPTNSQSGGQNVVDTMAAHREFLNKIHQQIQDEARIVSQPETGHPRKRKKTKQLIPKEFNGFECARARPFVFEPQVNGVKPPRGNPDKRWGVPKRSPTGAGIMLSPSANSTSPSPLTSLVNLTSGVPPITPIRQTPVSSVQFHSTPLSAPSTTVLAGSVQKHSQSTPVPSIAPKSISSVQTQYLPQNTYKRTRLASVTENPSLYVGDTSNGNNVTNCHRDLVHRANSQTNIVKAVRSNFSPVTMNRTSMKFCSSSGGTVSTSLYGNPTRPYYGNPSAAVLGSQTRSPATSASSSNSSQQTQSLPSTPGGHSPSPSTSQDNVNRVDYSLTRPSHLSNPIIKRSVLKSVHPTTTVRLSNGTIPLGQRVSLSSGLTNNSHVQNTGTASSIINGSPGTQPPQSQSPSSNVNFSSVRRLVATPHSSMPVGQFLLKKGSPAQFHLSNTPSPTEMVHQVVQHVQNQAALARGANVSTVYIQSSSMNGTSLENIDVNEQVTFGLSGSEGDRGSSDGELIYQEIGNSTRKGSESSVYASVSPVVTSPSVQLISSNQQVEYVYTSQPSYELHPRVFKVFPGASEDGETSHAILCSPSVVNDSYVLPQSDCVSSRVIYRSGSTPTSQSNPTSSALDHQNTEHECDIGSVQPVADILQQSMMEIS